ncbi:MAG TPA: LamG-like jellyroll fold domain-containing protein [Candidatus Saccharimonadales bacterium]|nr:LamG-like jellyroll fold domain-containing protein [Candidatus Saccharimonadales bacterium]
MKTTTVWARKGKRLARHIGREINGAFRDFVWPLGHALTVRSRKWLFWRVAVPAGVKTVAAGYRAAEATRTAHTRLAKRPHAYLLERLEWYRRWHAFRFRNHAHAAFLSVYCLGVVFLVFSVYRGVHALSDLTDTWNFSSSAGYSLSSGIETSGTSARLKAQNYASDGSTAALYHFDESSGTNASDSSSNNNAGTVASGGTFGSGNLNNALSLNGTTAQVSANDSASLSLSQDNTLEAWTKFSSTFGATTHDQRQSVIDKGAYKLYYDQETGKVTYELANASATTWTQQAGSDIKGSWDLNGKFAVNAQVTVGGNVYAGLGNAVGDAEVWKWDGTNWSQIGGDGKNSSWADQTYENVMSMAVNGTILYAGLGSTAGDGEVWSCDTATGCTTWTKIGGDGINNSWPVNTIEEVDSMSVFGGNLYVGLGLTATTDARVYKWNGTTWSWIGGNGVSLPFNAWPAGYEGVFSMTNDGTNLYVGLGTTAGDGDVWELTGNTWTQIGGDALNSSWAAATIEEVVSLRWFSGNLYAGTGLTAGDAEVWKWNGTSWTKIGGEATNSSWAAATYEGVYSFTDDGTNLYAGLGNTAGDNEVWKWNGTVWSQIGGDGLNGGFTNTHTEVNSMLFTGGLLYAGLVSTNNNAEVWTFNGTTWTRIGGGYVNKSWGYFNLQDVETMTVVGDYLYAGTGNTVAGNAQVWRFDGSTWTLVGGQGVNSSWAANTYEDTMSLQSYGGALYAGFGTTAGDGDVWKWNGTSWTQVGGDGLNSGWAAATYEEVYSMAAYGGNLYAGLGNSANDAEVWKWNGTSWTKIGGDSINSGWTANYERVSSLAVLGGQLYAGLGVSTGDAEVWRWNGAAWSKVGGDGVNSSWNLNYEQVESMLVYNGQVYAGLGNSTADAELWVFNGTTWSQIAGDGLNSSWIDGQYEQVKSLGVYNGQLYAGLGNSAGDGEVWVMDSVSGAWSKVGGGGTNSSWSAGTIETIRSLATYRGKLYAGLGDTANADAQVWSYGSNGFLQSTTVGQDTNWHHIAATYDGTTMKLYIDGTLDASTAVSLTMPDTNQALLIGSTFGTGITGHPPGYFAGALDEVRISNVARSGSGFTDKPYASTPQTITLASAVRKSGVWHFDTFASSETPNGGSLTYRLSDDEGTSWKYWNGSGWVLSASTAQANPIATINTNIGSFPVTYHGIAWQAVLSGNGSQQVTLNSLTMQSTSDTTAPSTAGMSVTALKAASGSVLASNAWTNGGAPYFSWNAGSDTGSGVKGYCAYVGTDNTADPVTTKGLLGASPATTGGFCQFEVDALALDLGGSGIMATPLSTSNLPYYVTLKAIDNAGNVSSSSVQFHFRFDNTPPTNPGFITAPSGFINTKTVTLTWPTSGSGAPDDANSGLVGLQYRIGSGGTWYGDSHSGTGDITDLLGNDGSYTTTDPPDFASLQEGTNTVYFRTWDQAGNVTTSYTTAAVKINTAGTPSEPQNVTATPSTNTVNAFAFSWSPPATFVGNVNNLTYCYTINALPSASNCTFTSGGVTSLGSGPYATQPGANTFYVVARDESSNINYDSYASATFTANTTAPGIPLNVDIVDVSIKSTSNWRLALTWDTPTNVGAGISAYKVYRSTDNTNFSLVGSSSSTTYIDAGLSQQRYYYYVRACDSTNNCGSNSATVNDLPTGKFTSPATLVADPAVSNITTRRATITWSTDRGSDSKVALGTTSGQYSPSEFSNSAQVSAHEIDLDNLSAGTTYYYVVKWTDEDGNTGQSQEFSFTTAPPPVLKEITTLTIGLSNATIQFSSQNASKISLFYGKSEAFGGVKTLNTSASDSTYAINIDGLDDGAKYFYKLVSFDSEGNAYDGSIFSFSTPARPHISNVRFQPVPGEPTSTQQVSWQTNVPTTSTITYGVDGTGGTEATDSTLVTDHLMTISDLADDSQYFLIAQSRDKDGNLATSDRQVFHTALDTRPPKISNVTVEASIRGTGAEARGQVVVSWHTDEPATSQVAFAEGSGATTFNNRTAEDTGLSFEHIVIVSDLPTSKVYSVQPLSRDKAGNVGNGGTEPAIIGHASDDVLTIVINSLRKIFGL